MYNLWLCPRGGSLLQFPTAAVISQIRDSCETSYHACVFLRMGLDQRRYSQQLHTKSRGCPTGDSAVTALSFPSYDSDRVGFPTRRG